VPLRESYQMFFFSSTVFFALKFINSRKYKFLIISFLSLFLLGITHNGLIVAVSFMLLFFLLYYFVTEKRKFIVGNKIFIMMIFIWVYLYWINCVGFISATYYFIIFC